MADIICSGFGGQGVLTTGLILAKTGMDNGKSVTWIPSYGSEMRGGTANCNVKISSKKISSPFVKDIDILIVMNEPSIRRFEAMVKPGGVVISNKSIITNYKFRQDIKVVEVSVTEIADRLENPRGANIAIIGAMAAATTLFDKEVIKRGIENFFIAKGKSNPKNIMCFEKGYEEATQYIAKG